jgi:hypothetical protein
VVADLGQVVADRRQGLLQLVVQLAGNAPAFVFLHAVLRRDQPLQGGVGGFQVDAGLLEDGDVSGGDDRADDAAVLGADRREVVAADPVSLVSCAAG